MYRIKVLLPFPRMVFLAVCMFTTMAHADDLKTRVKNELDTYYSSPFAISVAQPGEVTLKGTVRSYWDKRNVYSIVSRVPGVMAIKDELIVNTDLLPAKIIEANIISSLKLNRAIVEPEKIQVAVNNGEVILRGTVSFAREANVAEDIASWQPGVLTVANDLTVLPPFKAMSDENITAIVKNRIADIFPLEKDDVRATCLSGKVTLTGSVPTIWSKNAMAKEVSHIQGVTKIDNQIIVTSPDQT